MIIETKKLKDLKAAPYNARKSSEKQEKHLIESLVKFGVVEPVVFNKRSGFIVGGHFRVRELIKLGHKDVECVIVDLSDEDEKELNIRLNANTGEWNWDMLNTDWEASDLAEWGLEVPEFDTDQDFSEKNKEINIDEMDAEMIIKLKYSEEEYNIVKGQLQKLNASPEQAVWKLLGNE